MIIRFLGTHNEESSTTRLASMLIDEIIAVDAGSLVSELSFAEQEKIKAILLSHGHYDHIKAIPAYAFSNSHRLTKVFTTAKTASILTSHLLNGVVYPRFAEANSFLKRPVLDICRLEGLRTYEIEGYQVVAIPLNHPLETVGFSITSTTQRSVFYLTDTGPGLDRVWEQLHTAPQLLIIDTTYPNRLANLAREAGHLCPQMLATELSAFSRIKGYLPKVVIIHVSPKYEAEIAEEVSRVAQEIDTPIAIAREGDSITV